MEDVNRPDILEFINDKQKPLTLSVSAGFPCVLLPKRCLKAVIK